VDLAAELAELPLDRGVDVFVLRLDRALLRNPDERGARRFELVAGQEPGRVEPLGMERGGLAVVREQLGVVGVQERLDLRREARGGARRPERHTVARLRLSAATSSVSSDAIRMNPSAASCGNVSPSA
jgi:hypothetical protein